MNAERVLALRAAESVGAQVEEFPDGSVNVWAPDGFVWIANGAHAVSAAPDCMDVLLEDIRGGFMLEDD